MVEVVNVAKVAMAKGCCEASRSRLTSAGQKTSPSEVVGPSVCSPSPCWPVLMIGSLVMLGVVDVVIVVEVNFRTKVINEALHSKWLKKV
jgi:hypothetical protein